MKQPERCKACVIYQFYTTQKGQMCQLIDFKIPNLCPCYDCIVITTCQIDCTTYDTIIENLKAIKRNPKIKSRVYKFLQKEFGVNSLGPLKEKSNAKR
jgi:hypothetical protein